MPGMNKSSRTISLLTSLLAELESNPNRNVIEALAVLDEIRGAGEDEAITTRRAAVARCG